MHTRLTYAWLVVFVGETAGEQHKYLDKTYVDVNNLTTEAKHDFANSEQPRTQAKGTRCTGTPHQTAARSPRGLLLV